MLHKLTLITTLLAAAAPGLYALSPGAPPARSGAPGDGLCTDCHRSSAANSGSGNVKLTFSGGGTNYTPGQKQRVTVTITDPNGQRWGFELTARVTGAAAATTGAGTLEKVDNNAQLLPSSGSIQWMTQTSEGTRRGTPGPATFDLDWTAPATDVGTVDFYVAGNAANNNGNNQGDQIYTSKMSLTPLAAGPKPKPTVSDGGVVNGASLKAGITAGSWFSIFGTNLASSTRTWRDNEFVAGKLPTALDETKVTVNGKPAAVYFISPGQINAQAPDDTATGNVNVVVTTGGGESAPMAASLQQAAPAFFPFDPQGRRYAAAVTPTGTYVGPDGLFGTALASRPARPGEVIMLFGTGFGLTNPVVKAGEIFSGAAKLASDVTITIGGLPAQVGFAGLSGAGLYQFNVTVPAGAPDGDQPVVATISGVKTLEGVFVSVRK